MKEIMLSRLGQSLKVLVAIYVEEAKSNFNDKRQTAWELGIIR